MKLLHHMKICTKMLCQPFAYNTNILRLANNIVFDPNHVLNSK